MTRWPAPGRSTAPTGSGLRETAAGGRGITTMNRALGSSLLALVMAAASLPPFAPPAAAFRDCCFIRPTPPRLTGVAFHGRIEDGIARLERAGFGDYDQVQRRIAGLGFFDETALTAFERVEPGGISGTLLTPTIARFELACGSSFAAGPMPMGGHPNDARLLRTVIAVVADLDRSCAQLAANPVGKWQIGFGPAFDDPTLGARVREARFDLGGLRVIAPTDSSGIAARWLAAGGPRWIGFAVEVGNLDETAWWLRRETVPFDRPCVSILRIDPDTLDGLLVEFVQKRDRAETPSCPGIRF